LPASSSPIILSHKPTNEVTMDPHVQAYIDSVSDARRELYLRLQARLMELYPDLSVKKSYGVVKYYRGKGYIYLGYWKQGVSLYPGKIAALEEFEKRHPEIRTRVGTINLKVGDDLPWRDVEMVMEGAVGIEN